MKKSPLAEALANPIADARFNKTRCVIGQAVDNAAEDGPAVQGAIDDPRWSISSLTNVLNDKGIRVSSNALTRHRKQQCMCYRKAAA